MDEKKRTDHCEVGNDRSSASVETTVSLGADHAGWIITINGVRVLRLFLEWTWRT